MKDEQPKPVVVKLDALPLFAVNKPKKGKEVPHGGR
jgi:hypothetical protein